MSSMEEMLAKYKQSAGTKRKAASSGSSNESYSSESSKSAKIEPKDKVRCQPDEGPPHFLILGACAARLANFVRPRLVF